MTRGMVVRPTKCATRRISPSQGTRKTNLYRRLKRRLGRSLRSRLYRGSLVSSRKASTHQLIRNEGSFSGPTILQKDLSKQSSPHRLRQHLSGGIHQQTGWHSIGRTLCPDVENPNMVQSEQCDTQSTTHPGITQRNSRRPLQEEPDPINRVVPLSTNLQTNFQTLGESPSGPIRNQPEYKTPSLRLSNSRPSGVVCGCPEHSMGKPGCVCFPSHRPAAQGCTKTSIPDLQDNSHRPRLANKTMVLGSSGDVSGHTKTTTTHSHSAQTTTEQPIPCKPSFPQSPRVVSRSSTLKERGFTAEVAETIAAPQRLSTRAIYSSKWTVFFQKWCTEEQVDFRNPSISDICNFFWYLFNVLNRCPSTIEGYRTAIADTLGNTKQNISNNVDIARLIASFYRDKPKGSRNIPKWNLSVVLHTLSQPPFEPQEQADLKFLTWKVVFLLVLASGKRCSEIHAWTLDGLLCLGDWEQVQLVPSPSFIAKNELAKDGLQSISSVVIPTLKYNQGSKDTDILLRPIRALRCYLDRTRDLRGDRQLLFISFKQGHTKDIQCSTISSWIKNTIKFCYSKVDNADMDLLGVKAHDVRAFAASKAFYGGVSMDQIMQACHWKSHNTFTRLYLKDLAGQDQTEGSYHLGAFIAAQQVMPPSTSAPGTKEGGGTKPGTV